MMHAKQDPSLAPDVDADVDIDVENDQDGHARPAVVQDKQDKNKNPGLEGRRRGSRWDYLRKGWVWGTIIGIVAVSTVAPIAVRVQRSLKEVPPARPQVAMAGFLDASGRPAPPSCADVAGDLPPATSALAGGFPPPPLRVDGGGLRVANGGGGRGGGGDGVVWRGFTWPGFDSDRGFVALPGLLAPSASEGDKKARAGEWASGDLATVAATLRLAGGFNAVRLPFDFGALEGGASPANDVRRPCPGPPPSAEALGKRASDPESPATAAGAPKSPAERLAYLPLPGGAYGVGGVGGGGGLNGTCNAGAPSGPSSLARLLWATELLVRGGQYVVLSFEPQPAAAAAKEEDGDERASSAATSSPEALAAAWQRVAAALTCLPAWRGALAGRVALEVLGGGGGSGGGDEAAARFKQQAMALAALDALGPIGGGDDARPQLLLVAPDLRSSSGGDGGDDAFLDAIAGRPYAGRVLRAARESDLPAAAAASPPLVVTGVRQPGGGDGAAAAAGGAAVAAITSGGGGGGQPAAAGWFWWSLFAPAKAGGGLMTGGSGGEPAINWDAVRWMRGALGLPGPWNEQPQRRRRL